MTGLGADIIEGRIPTKGDVPVQKVIDGAADARLEQVFILGRHPNGGLYAAASTGCAGDLLLMVEEWKHELLSGRYA